MNQSGKKIAIVGGGIAGLCTAVYARLCGYEAEVFEMNAMAGGLATSWSRGHYTFETCLHWLLGSKPGGELHAAWLDVVDLDKLTFVNSDVFTKVQTEQGDSLTIYTNVDRLEAELLKRSPQDKAEILRLTRAVRLLSRFKMPDPVQGAWANAWVMLKNAGCLGVLDKFTRMRSKDYGRRFHDPLIRSFFDGGEMGELSAIALVFSLAFMHAGNAAYAIGGSQTLIRGIEQKLAGLGGQIRFGARVDKILVADGRAVGVRLANGETVKASWVVSAADGHGTIHELLEGNFIDSDLVKHFETMQTFPSYLQVSLGVAIDLKGRPPLETYLLDEPIHVDDITDLNSVGFRFFHFDPTFAPPGKTAVTCFLPTYNFGYWTHLERENRARYCAEKKRVAERVIAVLEKHIAGLRPAIEVVDVSTPATVIRYTGNWKGSMEGWLLTPATRFKPLSNTLPGLERFVMAGQWVMPGGGLPSGLITARMAMRKICQEDGVEFVHH